MEISLGLTFTNFNQVKLVQIRYTHCRLGEGVCCPLRTSEGEELKFPILEVDIIFPTCEIVVLLKEVLITNVR